MEILKTLLQLGDNLIDLGRELYPMLLPAALLLAWIAWWLWGVNWHKAFPALVSGGWAPLVLIMIISALVWSRIAPSRLELGGVAKLANFWWQLAAVGLYVGTALFCGWLQLYFQISPPEINLEPPSGHEAHGHHHGHDSHGHGHEHGHDSHGHTSHGADSGHH